ncbi:Hsp20/alpha crystallin family protein [Oceanispirochaeta crateris]|uniref:Hsp20/alpha crystallin family protein n=1 Tax=Oceanispirochaeta crateris TaxID=2518645 RepID=A0A5C1QQR4_9SPIO|nr:Hsp20/alpha crystallin family protein [Oceanispirochaeta crateris]QEN09569.1 Hsp20/alpha crystallin family protein [Oceanispirochaeta crateris]
MTNLAIRRNPVYTVNPWKEMERIFNTAISTDTEPRKPLVHVENEESRVVLTVELPGFASEDLDIQVNENLLTIKALQKGKKKKDEEITIFERSFVLPEDLNRESIKAEMKNGLLTLELLRKEKPAPLAIKVKG